MQDYDHKKIEGKWQKVWEKKRAFEAKDNDKKPKFYGLIEFPYPSGDGLHVGHIRSNTAMDVIARKRRMEGFNVLYPIGWDAFGLPTENYAIKTGIHPTIVTKQNTDTFRRQLKEIGFSFDWSREINTTDPKYYKWTQWIFLQLLKHGLAYKKKMPINWCPKDKIGLANEEVVDGKCERCDTPVEKRDKEQWMLAITKYADRLDKDLDTVDFLEKIKIQQRNWIGRSEGAEIEFGIKNQESGIKILPKKILIGTRNPAKIKMVKEAFPKSLGIEFVSLDDVSVDDSSLTEGDDFRENARKKSEFYFQKTGIPTISTDHIIWVEKYQENNGFIVHARKLANPNSPRATDEEVGKWVENFIDKHGESKSAFHYGVAYTDKDGTLDFAVKQKEYILQKEKSPKKNEGYVFDRYLKDAETGELRIEQNFEKGFQLFNEFINKEFIKIFSDGNELKIKVFTTRPDTLFGCTYLVLAPEHPLVENLKSKIENWDEVLRYIVVSKKKTEMERTEESKEKTGVELKGVKAINPANREEVSVWIADFVLADYGTGAVFADAHDERDFIFAKKYGIPLKTTLKPVDGRDESNIKELKECFSGKGILYDSAEFSGLTSEQAIPKITEKYGKLIVKYKLRDWVFSRQHYWGEPIPVVFCTKCFAKENNLNAVIVHGCPSNIENAKNSKKRTYDKHWIPWTKKQLDKLSIKTENPFMPEPWDASYENWKKEFEKQTISDKTILIGHSCGTAFLVRWLGETKRKVFGLILVAPWKIPYGEGEQRKRKEAFYNYEIDLEIKNRIKNIAIFTSDNEEEDGKKSSAIFESALGARLISLKNYGHYTLDDMGKEEFSEILELISSWASEVVPIPEKDLPVELPKVEKYLPTDTGESPLAGIKSFVDTECPQCGGPARRETDTMPNWAGSSWYYLAYCISENLKSKAPISKQFSSTEIQNKLKYWSGIPLELQATPKERVLPTGQASYKLQASSAGPVNWYNGGMEHTTLHLLYSRFWHKFLFDIGVVPTSEPYKKRTSHGLILAEGGVKMSKSKGNVINPDDLIKRFGADALRVYEMFMGPFDQAIAWSTDGLVGTRRFLEKVWRIGERITNKELRIKDKDSSLQATSYKLPAILHRTVKKVEEDIEEMRFNTAISSLMICANEMDLAESVPKELFEMFIKILSPFAPHVAEELWQNLGNKGLIVEKSWPAYDPNKIKDEMVTIVVQVNGKVRGQFSAPPDISESEAIEKAKSLPEIKKWTENKEIKKAIFVKGRLVNFVI